MHSIGVINTKGGTRVRRHWRRVWPSVLPVRRGSSISIRKDRSRTGLAVAARQTIRRAVRTQLNFRCSPEFKERTTRLARQLNMSIADQTTN